MTKTTNYQLPQWEAHDPIQRRDFNDAMSVIDAGMAQKDYAVGSYAGNSGTQVFSVGFRPSLVIIGRQYYSDLDTATHGTCYVSGDSDTVTDPVVMTDDGFEVIQGKNYPQVNWTGDTYFYIAFR